MFGSYPMSTIYFFVLIICAAISLLLVVFGDVFSFDGPLDPMLLVPLVAFTALFGYAGERLTQWPSLLILFLAIGVASIAVFLLNFYVLVPLRHADATMSMSEKDLEGQLAIVTTPIPLHGMGEIRYKSVTGSMSRPASFYKEGTEDIAAGQEVLIIEVRERVCYVIPYKKEF